MHQKYYQYLDNISLLSSFGKVADKSSLHPDLEFNENTSEKV